MRRVYTVDVSDSSIITFRLRDEKVEKLRLMLRDRPPGLAGIPEPSLNVFARALVLEAIERDEGKSDRIRALEEEISDLRDKWLRTVAEFENYKKKMEGK